MGQRGFAPAPATLKVLKGETRPSRLKNAPHPLEPPQKPDDLSSEAGEVWDRILSVTDHIGERYAETFRQFCEATAAVNQWQPKGTKEWRELVNVHRQLARELCLTPATGAAIANPPTESKLSKYLAG